MFLVWGSAYPSCPCSACGKLYCHENGDFCLIMMDWLIELQHPGRDTLEEKQGTKFKKKKKGKKRQLS